MSENAYNSRKEILGLHKKERRQNWETDML